MRSPRVREKLLTRFQSLGAAAAWIDTIETFGSGNVTRADVFAPAIRLAEEGWVRSTLLQNLSPNSLLSVPVSEIHGWAVRLRVA